MKTLQIDQGILHQALKHYGASNIGIKQLVSELNTIANVICELALKEEKYDTPPDIPIIKIKPHSIAKDRDEIQIHNTEIILTYLIYESWQLTKYMKKKVIRPDALHFIKQGVYFGLNAKVGFLKESVRTEE